MPDVDLPPKVATYLTFCQLPSKNIVIKSTRGKMHRKSISYFWVVGGPNEAGKRSFWDTSVFDYTYGSALPAETGAAFWESGQKSPFVDHAADSPSKSIE